VQVPPKLILTNVLKSLGINDAEFTKLELGDCFQVQVQFHSRLPSARQPAVRDPRIKGDISRTLQLAESSAIKNACGCLVVVRKFFEKTSFYI